MSVIWTVNLTLKRWKLNFLKLVSDNILLIRNRRPYRKFCFAKITKSLKKIILTCFWFDGSLFCSLWQSSDKKYNIMRPCQKSAFHKRDGYSSEAFLLCCAPRLVWPVPQRKGMSYLLHMINQMLLLWKYSTFGWIVCTVVALWMK